MMFEGKSILVTGGTGSMGKTFVRRVLSGVAGTPRKLIVFSRDEGKQHDMRVSYLSGPKASTDEVIAISRTSWSSALAMSVPTPTYAAQCATPISW
jgi:FlaA1/EpsC-like NDP-sugar epimerase